MLTLMDGVVGDTRNRVVVIATTSRPNTLDPALRRAGRFDKEIEVGVPSKQSRGAILRHLFSKCSHSLSDEDFEYATAMTHGFVGADLTAVKRVASLTAFKRTRELMKSRDTNAKNGSVVVGRSDLETALRSTKPSAMREVIVEVPSVEWSDVGGLADVKEKLKEAVEWPVKRPEVFERMGVKPPCGVLLYGPPGCSKTLLAQALAHETKLNFIAVKGPQLLSKYVGESERAVSEVFAKARQNAPCILFFVCFLHTMMFCFVWSLYCFFEQDEIDGLVGHRRDASSEGGVSRVLSQMLTEMDGVQPIRNVVVLAATNRPDLLDEALLRPGRVDRALYCRAPDENERYEILKICCKRIPHDDEDLVRMARETVMYSGAELAALCNTASLIALRQDINVTKLTSAHWDSALEQCPASTITIEMLSQYASFRMRSTQQQQ